MSAHPDDPYDLNRFLEAQRVDYAIALAELIRGEKRSHWMWFIFPQVAGLGFSSTSRYYAIRSLDEARAYLAHPVLGPRLLDCAAATLAVAGRSARQIFGMIDAVKLKSSATLFALAAPPDSLFQRLLEKYFQGRRDEKTLQLLGLEFDD